MKCKKIGRNLARKNGAIELITTTTTESTNIRGGSAFVLRGRIRVDKVARTGSSGHA